MLNSFFFFLCQYLQSGEFCLVWFLMKYCLLGYTRIQLSSIIYIYPKSIIKWNSLCFFSGLVVQLTMLLTKSLQYNAKMISASSDICLYLNCNYIYCCNLFTFALLFAFALTLSFAYVFTFFFAFSFEIDLYLHFILSVLFVF